MTTETKYHYISEEIYFSQVIKHVKKQDTSFNILSINRTASMVIAWLCSILLKLIQEYVWIYEIKSDKEWFAVIIECPEQTDKMFLRRIDILCRMLEWDSSKLDLFIDNIRTNQKIMLNDLLSTNPNAKQN